MALSISDHHLPESSNLENLSSYRGCRNVCQSICYMMQKAIPVRENLRTILVAVCLLVHTDIICISAAGYEVVNVTQSPPPVQNVTVGRYCELTCPFNNATATLDPEVYGTPDTQQPCVYTVRITEVFQGNFTVS